MGIEGVVFFEPLQCRSHTKYRRYRSWTARFTWLLFAAVLVFATAVLAQTPGFNEITKPARNEKVPAGSTHEIVWQPGPTIYAGPITIVLIGGHSSSLIAPIDTLARKFPRRISQRRATSTYSIPFIGGIDGATAKYRWAVDKSLGPLPIYGVQIVWVQDVSVFQYSFPFQIISDGASGSASGTVSVIRTARSTTASTPSTSSTSSSSQTASAGDKAEQSSTSVPIVVPVVLGVVLGLAALAALGWFLWRRNKRKKQAAMVPELEDSNKDKPGHYGPVGELPGVTCRMETEYR